MQSRAASTLLAAAFLAALQLGGALTVSTAEGRAAAWLRVHGQGAPSGDELSELKAENPEAYGIVKALLMKRQLGLLDPKHPSASFAAAKAPAEVPGAEAFKEMAVESGEKASVAPLYPDAPAPVAHHNWLNWKPQQSALDDEAMVNNVLGSVAELKGGHAADAAPGADGDELKWTSPSADALAAVKPVAQVASPTAAVAAPSQENSYLKSLDLGGASTAGDAAPTKNFLTSFSWDDKEPAEKPQAEAAAPATPSAGKKPKNALLSWLR